MSTVVGRALRAISSAVLWLLVAVGVLCGGLWAANAAGLVQPLVVASGSMSPGIRTGDLLFATPTPASEVAVGEVTTLHSEVTGKLVTHRVIEITRSGDTVSVRMQGDANQAADPEAYVVDADASVWQPTWTIPGGSYAVMTLMRPAVAIPGMLGILALVGLTLLPARRPAVAPEAVPA
ncbi:signal peptidase I [Microbacterium terricola]|uniref:Signal peptidase I n=1 Tax=Microbacterium terricola TaxID=344163 RepID=A0ABM8E2S0_9MICO|nr:signal peptidase I [Microbacterium terricola]UYK40227.1 signal peptidase I [Microbacterium terricola]BDV32066.1 hypothetical protein Microterr_27260 [Microbacterium terricola]